MATKHTYIYCRISEDKQGRREGVEAQERWGREYAIGQWPAVPVKVFADNDLSAAKDDVVRPRFQDMRDGIRRGECAHLWAVEQSRLTRLEPEWFSLAADLVRADVNEVHTKRGGVVDAEGVVGGIMAVLNAYEVRQLRKRLKDKLGELAREGRPMGHVGSAYVQVARSEQQRQKLEQWWQARDEARQRGEDMRAWRERNPRPAGGASLTDDEGRKAAQLDQERAELIRWAAEQILNGWTLTEVARDFRRRGARGAYGGIMGPGNIRAMLTAPAVAGLRAYHGEIIGKATWEPVLDEATWRAVRGRLNGGKQRQKLRAARRYLLSRFAVCASCGRAMNGTWVHTRGKSWYHCTYVAGTCGNTGIQSVPADDYVAGELLRHLASRDIAAPEDEHAARRDRIAAELEALDGQRREWVEARDAGQLNLAEFLAAKAKFDGRQAHLETDLAGIPAPVRKLDPDQLREAWPEMTLSEQRQVLSDWIERVVIHPRPPRPGVRDVALKAGVSAATVTRVFTHPAAIADGGGLATRTAERTAAETAIAVRTLSAANPDGVTARQLAGFLKVTRNRAEIRLAAARDRGYVTAAGKGRRNTILWAARRDLPDLPEIPSRGDGPDRILEATASRVRAAAAEIGYVYQPQGAPRFDAGRAEIIWRQ